MGGGGKSGKSAPESPDFMGIAREQGGLSREATREQTFANRPDQYGPFGSTTWEYEPGEPVAGTRPAAGSFGVGIADLLRGDGGQDASTTEGPGRWTQRTGLSPGLQTAADRLMAQVGEGAGLDPAAARERAIEGAYGMQTSRLDPRFRAGRAARETQLANEGFTRGDEGWRTGMDEFGRGENDAYQQALLAAQSGAGNTAFAQALAAAMQPYQQLGAIRGLSQAPGFTPAGQPDIANMLGAAMQKYGADIDRFNSAQGGKNSKMNAGAGLGAAALMAPAAPAAGVWI